MSTKKNDVNTNPVNIQSLQFQKKENAVELDDAFVTEHMPLIESIAANIASRGALPPCIHFEDLKSWGIEGLIKAFNNYESDKGSQFNTYAYYRIRGEMMDRIRREWNYRNPSEYNEYRKEIQQRIADFAENFCEHGGEKLEGSVLDLVAGSGLVYLISGENADYLSDENRSGDPAIKLDSAETEKEEKNILLSEINELTDEEKELIQLFYFKGLKQKEIADQLKFSKSKVCRMHTRILEKLRRRLSRRLSIE